MSAAGKGKLAMIAFPFNNEAEFVCLRTLRVLLASLTRVYHDIGE